MYVHRPGTTHGVHCMVTCRSVSSLHAPNNSKVVCHVLRYRSQTRSNNLVGNESFNIIDSVSNNVNPDNEQERVSNSKNYIRISSKMPKYIVSINNKISIYNTGFLFEYKCHSTSFQLNLPSPQWLRTLYNSTSLTLLPLLLFTSIMQLRKVIDNL
jgi:hypothetical protein